MFCDVDVKKLTKNYYIYEESKVRKMYYYSEKSIIKLKATYLIYII